MQWTVKNTPAANDRDRDSIVSYIKGQKARLSALGIDYCPYFSNWGYGVWSVMISERAREAVYREVEYLGNYGKDICSALKPELNNWGEGAWNSSPVSYKAVCNGDKSGCARLNFFTDTRNNKTALTKMQCYKFLVSIDLSQTKLKAGDVINVWFFRKFAQGQKPDPSKIPFGKMVVNDYLCIFGKDYTVKQVYAGNRYYIVNNVNKPAIDYANSFTDTSVIWVDTCLSFGAGNHTFEDSLRWDVAFYTHSDSSNNSITFTDFKVIHVNPLDQMAYPKWEKSKDYNGYVNHKYYPFEKLMTTFAVYANSGRDTTIRHFIDKAPSSKLKLVKGNFLPYTAGMGSSPDIQFSTDPLSPAYDLIAQEMLRIIKQGLGNTEPKYYHFAGDEVFVYKRNAACVTNGPYNTVYNKCGNMEFYARIMHKNIQRYKLIFKGDTTATCSAKFLFWGDMILPFGHGYTMYAEKNNDQGAMKCLKQNLITDTVIPVIWIYDYASIPGKNNQFFLYAQAEVQKSIDFLKNNGLGYAICYATDGKKVDLARVNSSVDTDTKHIQHEIDLARNWCDIVSSNANRPHFQGYLYTGWGNTPNVRTNRWNGLYPLAYFGWLDQNARDLPEKWKTFENGSDGEPVLKLLERNECPPAED